MNRWTSAVRQFGEEMGMPELALTGDGQFAIALDTGRHIAAEVSGEEMLVYASDPVPYDGAQRLLRAWRRAYLTQLDGRPIQAALREQQNQMRLLAVVRLRTDECSAHALRAAINHVSHWLDDIRSH